LGFKAEAEVKIPRGKIDCVWESKEPVSEYFIAFEFETAIKGPQIVENLVKALSLPSQMRPRFLVQIYRDELEDANREYIENISSKLPITIKIIDNVGSDVEKACPSIITELFNWISEYAEIPEEFLARLEKIPAKENIIKVFHYGESSWKIIIFTSDCSPAWGTPSIETEGFRDMWKQIMETFILSKNLAS